MIDTSMFNEESYLILMTKYVLNKGLKHGYFKENEESEQRKSSN